MYCYFGWPYVIIIVDTLARQISSDTRMIDA